MNEDLSPVSRSCPSSTMVISMWAAGSVFFHIRSATMLIVSVHPPGARLIRPE
jgi:hypothetical protein